MEFRALGPVAVAAGTQAIAFDRGRRRTLLALLLAAGGESVTTDGLIASLWDDHPPASARKSLQSHLSRLRSELQRIDPTAPSALVSAGDGYRLDLEHHAFDAARFESAGRFDDGVVVAALAAVRDPATVGEALVTALGIQPTGERAAGETLVHALGDRRLLLLLDNCEHLLGAVAPLVEEIRGRCPNVAVLATSRERLHLAGERLWPVAPLGVPGADAGPEAVAATPAGALFRARAEAVEPTFTLTTRNTPAIAELCRRLDGMPLAIELAAARVRAMSPQDLVARLDQRFSLLAGGPRHEAGRHRTLQAVVAWSYDLLDPVEARLFDRLSVFAGAFSLDDAEHVCAGDEIDEGEVAGLLGELVDKSMVVVERDRERVRYRLLDTLREYGMRRLAEVDDPEVWRRRHADHHVDLVERLGVQVRGPREAVAVAAIDAAFGDLRSAHTWLVGRGDVDGALRLPAALADHAFYRLRDEVTAWARRSVAMAGAAEHPAYAAALATAASGATSRDERGRARTEAGEALEAADPDGLARAWALGALGTAALYEGRLGDLLAHAEEMAEVSRRLSAPYYLAFADVLEVIGRAYRDEHEEALAGTRGPGGGGRGIGQPHDAGLRPLLPRDPRDPLDQGACGSEPTTGGVPDDRHPRPGSHTDDPGAGADRPRPGRWLRRPPHGRHRIAQRPRRDPRGTRRRADGRGAGRPARPRPLLHRRVVPVGPGHGDRHP